MSYFKKDLAKEQLLGKYLDSVYLELGIPLKRVDDINEQHQGIDLKYKAAKNDYFIDEKAQLDYIDSDLPTFTFEISYLKDSSLKMGWLFDKSKVTDFYFLVTSIYANDKTDLTKGFKSCKITSVDRKKLINHLASIKLTASKLFEYENRFRSGRKEGKNTISELTLNEGLIFFSTQKKEEPINLQLRLNYLISKGLAKQIYPTP